MSAEQDMTPGDEREDIEDGDRAGRGVIPLSIVKEIVLNMSILMFAAIVMIAFMINFTHGYMVDEYARYTPLIIIPYIVVFGVAVAVFGGRLISRLILKPLGDLIEATRRVAEGDLDTRVHISENVEMHKLGNSFNEMTRKLGMNRRQLEDNLEQMRKLNQDLSRTQLELLSSEKLASVGRLAAGVAHEIGNPLAAMGGHLEILSRRDYLKEGDKEIVDRIHNEVYRINEIIKELLDYSRPQDETREPVDVNESVDSALTLLAGHKGGERVEVSTELGQVPAVLANRSSVKQLVMNLALNSIQAMPEGGRLEIKTRPAMSGGKRGVEIVVSDSGPGIAEEHVERIFDPFFTTKEPGQGTGLGLSICMRIVENLEGRIRAGKAPEGGAMFTVWVPAAGPEAGSGRDS